MNDNMILNSTVSTCSVAISSFMACGWESHTLQMPLLEWLRGKKSEPFTAVEDLTHWREELGQFVIATQCFSLLYTGVYVNKWSLYSSLFFPQWSCCSLINIYSAVRHCAMFLYQVNFTGPLFQLAADAVKYTFSKMFGIVILLFSFKKSSSCQFLPAPVTSCKW